MSNSKKRRILEDKSIRISMYACFVGFGGFLLWGAFAQLEEGVSASGQIVVQDNRKKIQHFEGGIVSVLYVREGTIVDKDEILLELEPIQSSSARDELAQEFAVQAATLDRLMALRAERPTIIFQTIKSISLPDTIKTDIIARQNALFRGQLQARKAELSVLVTRGDALKGRQNDLSQQIAATRRQLNSAKQDLRLRREMLAERLETIGNVQQISREVAGYESSISRLIGEQNEAAKSEEEITNQIIEAKARFQETIGEQIVDAQARSLTARQRLSALDDRLARTVIRAPERGTILNLTHNTIGGVVSAGEVIMEIVPDTDDLIVNVRISPTDRDAISPGQTVKAQLSAYKSFVAPRLPGLVTAISADLKQDPTSGAFYYEAKVKLDTTELDPNDRIEIIPGMPVDAFIASGQTRTFLDYVFEPLRATFSRGTRMG